MKRAIWATSAITALVFSIGLGRIALRRTHDLDRRQQDAKQQADDLGRKAQSQAHDLERTLEFATAARDSAEAAARRALEAAAARISAEARTQASEEAKRAAEGEAHEATT
jgi:hypothetical protein